MGKSTMASRVMQKVTADVREGVRRKDSEPGDYTSIFHDETNETILFTWADTLQYFYHCNSNGDKCSILICGLCPRRYSSLDAVIV